MSSKTWPFTTKNVEGTSCSPDTEIGEDTLHQVKLRIKKELNNTPFDLFVGGVTADEKQIYVSTNSNRGNNFLIAVDRKSFDIVWKNNFSIYSGISGDRARAGAAVLGDNLYVGSSLLKPQTWEPLTNPTLFGFPTSGSGKRSRMYCINKYTGNLVWEKELGKVATKITDPDNMKFFTQSPIAVNMEWKTEGKIPVVFIGTSSGNSFVPFFSSSDQARQLSYGSDNPYISNATLWTMMRKTDVGTMYILDGRNGDVLKEISMGPKLYKEGDMLRKESIVNQEGRFEIRHIIEEEDLTLLGGELNPIKTSYGEGKMVISLLKGGEIVLDSPLVNQNVRNNLGFDEVVGVGVVPETLYGVTVTLNVTLFPGTTNFTVSNSFPPNKIYDLNTSNLAGFGPGHNVPAIINKNLKEGDILTDQDAYQCNYYGASVWSSSPVLNKVCGKYLELIITTGQAHETPYDETKRFDFDAEPGQGQRPLERTYNIKSKQENFQNNPNQITFEAIRKANDDKMKDIESYNNIPLSNRGDNFHFNSVICINLRKGKEGELTWYKKSEKFDTWDVSMNTSALRISGSPDGTLLPGFTDIQAHVGHIRGDDGDFGMGATISCNRVFCGAKNGTILNMEISQATETEESQILSSKLSLAGNPGLLGGANFGSAYENKNFMMVQANESNSFLYGVKNTPLTFPAQLDWYPLTQKNWKTNKPFLFANSYLISFDPTKNKVVWEEKLLGGNKKLPTATNISCGNGIVYVQPNELKLQARSVKTGKLLKEFSVEACGNSSALIMKNQIILCSGRSGFQSASPDGTNYEATKWLYVWQIKRCQ